MTTIRPARFDDVAAIARIEVETWVASYAGILPDRVLLGMSARRQIGLRNHALRTHSETVLVASEHGTPIGFGSCGTQRQHQVEYTGEVYTLYVAPDAQNRGVGRLLLRGLFEHLVGAGHGRALIWVLQGNPSRFFYQRMGGRAVLTRPIPVGGQPIEAVGYGWPDLKATLELPAARR